MTDPAKTSQETIHRVWRKEDRAKVSLMQIFRSNFEDRRQNQPVSGDPGEITQRIQFREGVSESELRAHIEYDLSALLNTINLESIESLDDAPNVASSILNYGFSDLSGVSLQEMGKPGVAQSIRRSLINHEPRFVASTLQVKVHKNQSREDQRVSLSVEAELMGDPVDIPLDFDADVDLGAGKLTMSKLRVDL